MCKKIICSLLVIMFTLIPHLCSAQTKVNVDSLINHPQKYDNKVITIEAEVIGEPMVRGNNVWINVNDGTCAIGIWTDKKILKNIKTYGNYHNKGDVIRVTGQFHFNCKEHGGDVDIHSNDINITERGYKVTRNINRKKMVASVLLVALTGMLAFTYYRKVVKSSK